VEQVFLDCGRLTAQLMRDPLGSGHLMTQFRRPLSLLFTLALTAGARVSLLSAQTPSDTLAVAKAIAEGVVHEAMSGGDHHAPFALIDSDSSVWGRPIAALLRSEHSNLLIAPSQHTLKMAVGDVTVFRDSAHATVIWFRCTEGAALVNLWEHKVIYLVERSRGVWHFIRRQPIKFTHGRC
jgi:hypothetical protein